MPKQKKLQQPPQRQDRQPGREHKMSAALVSPRRFGGSFVFLASDDSSYMTGQILHPNGGTLVNE
jgi:NAD(P)-dependent dehydrogenase (short-subunit alcohol dehydrogenase family)